MKLLLDENLSRRIPPALALRYPGSSHAVLEGLSGASDAEVWEWAAVHGVAIVTKDDDFQALSALRGAPPYVVRLVLGNCSNEQALHVLVSRAADIEQAFTDPEIGLVELA